jgi:hypothetical protein
MLYRPRISFPSLSFPVSFLTSMISTIGRILFGCWCLFLLFGDVSTTAISNDELLLRRRHVNNNNQYRGPASVSVLNQGNPTIVSTTAPTTISTATPEEVPTAYPSYVPSAFPTLKPSVAPTLKPKPPSLSPTRQPSRSTMMSMDEPYVHGSPILAYLPWYWKYDVDDVLDDDEDDEDDDDDDASNSWDDKNDDDDDDDDSSQSWDDNTDDKSISAPTWDWDDDNNNYPSKSPTYSGYWNYCYMAVEIEISGINLKELTTQQLEYLETAIQISVTQTTNMLNRYIGSPWLYQKSSTSSSSSKRSEGRNRGTALRYQDDVYIIEAEFEVNAPYTAVVNSIMQLNSSSDIDSNSTMDQVGAAFAAALFVEAGAVLTNNMQIAIGGNPALSSTIDSSAISVSTKPEVSISATAYPTSYPTGPHTATAVMDWPIILGITLGVAAMCGAVCCVVSNYVYYETYDPVETVHFTDATPAAGSTAGNDVESNEPPVLYDGPIAASSSESSRNPDSSSNSNIPIAEQVQPQPSNSSSHQAPRSRFVFAVDDHGNPVVVGSLVPTQLMNDDDMISV